VSEPRPIVLPLVPDALRSRSDFVPLRPGVDICWLYRDQGSGASAALLRYAPGARVPEHEHPGFEHIVVLEGSQKDQRGDYGPGTLVINPPNTRHSVESPDGCLVLIVWQRPVHFVSEAD
jgi:anti-sigma factor ChrR (cupin superfamily)